jgi:osmotically-inducible protein OsmY
MKHFLWLTPVVLSSALVLPACDKAQNEPAPRSENAPNIGATKTSDADLEKAVRAKLESDNAIKQADLSVSADGEANKATLSGMVVSQELRNKAITLARSAQPGLTIEDKIDVKPAG